MKENTQDKILIKTNKGNLFCKIRSFFWNIFNNKSKNENSTIVSENVDATLDIENNKKKFIESIKNIDKEEMELLDLQKKYRNGELKENELTEEQIYSLIMLYNKQITVLNKSNKRRKQRLLEYRKKIQKNK